MNRQAKTAAGVAKESANGLIGIYERMDRDGYPERAKALLEGSRLVDAAPEMVDELKALYAAYVRLLESGRDRILALGGSCDAVDAMEKGDPALISARAIIAKATGNSH